MFFFSSRRRHTRYWRDWSSDVCSSDLAGWFYPQSERFNAVSTGIEEQIRSGQLDRAPRFRDNRYGGMLGGPVKKNKLFFFGAFERETDKGTGSAYQFFAPTSAGLDQIADRKSTRLNSS